MSDIRFNTWLHQSGTGGITQVDGGHVGIGTTNPDIAVHTANAKKVNVGIVTANSVYATNFYGNGSNLTGLGDADKIEEGNTKVEVVDSGSQYIVGEVNGSERIRVDSTGKITHTATTNNTATLDLYGGNTTVSANGEVNAQLRFRSKDNSVTNSEENVGGAIKSIVEYSNGAYVGMSFETYKQDRTPRLKEALRITNAGNIGINDIGPANFTGYTNLSIHGSTGGAITFGDDGVDEWEIYGGDGTIKIYDRANTQERIRIVDNGAIGLGGANYGTSGQVLTSQGSGSPVQWATPAAPFGGALDGMIFGGVETTYTSGGTTYKVHSFLSTGFLRVTAATTMDFLIVAGGGGSPQAEGYHGSSGGGGAGGMVEGSSISIPAGKHTLTVGSGGAASDKYTVGGTGGDSTFAINGGSTITAKGGGGGADYATNAATGGSGGGGAEPNTSGGSSNQSSQNSGISGISQYGNAGGQGGNYTGSNDGSGGGGGAGGAGNARSSGGGGGSGRANSITGSSVTYAAGGAGGSSGVHNGTAGTNGRGNGASGASASGGEGSGAAGGSGIIIVRYVLS